MSSFNVPVDSMVPISRFGRGTASAEFAKVSDGHPVTVLRNNQPTYFILNAHDMQYFNDIENELLELRNAEARRQARAGEYDHTFDNVDDFMEYVNGLPE